MKIQMKDLIIINSAIVSIALILSCNRISTPNIILINADDLGYMDLAVYGSRYYETPFLDRMAEEGMLFTNGYSAASNCAPSRACLMTGLYTPRHGVYTVGSSARGKSGNRKLIPVKNTTRLDTAFTTIAEELQRAGYKTAIIGKWHLGQDPTVHGFDVNVGGGMNGQPGSYFAPYGKPDLEAPEGENLTDRLTREAIRFIGDNRDGKFFLYLPYYAVHAPRQGKEVLVEKYRNKPSAPGQNHADYAAMIETLDQGVGQVLKALDEMGISERTMVLFTSDNGGIRFISSQEPLRAGKASYYEGGVREPMIARWPGNIEAGTTCDVPVISIDFYPTFLELAGIEDPLNRSLDGRSIVPLLLGGEGFDADRALFWHFPIYLGGRRDAGRDSVFATRPGSSIRIGEWKLIEYFEFEEGGLELYNLEEDLGERNNLAEKLPEKTKELHEMLLDWRSETAAPVPSALNPEYEPAGGAGDR
jgi:arylsulfatase A-like enzyme